MELLVTGALVLLTMIPNGAIKIQESLLLSPAPSPKIESITPTPTPKQIGPKIHTVKSGETLDRIAKKYYGSSAYWTLIWNDNEELEDPRIINAGLELKIRRAKPVKNEVLKVNLAKIYEEIINPSPTPAPTNSPDAPIQRTLLPAGSFEQTYKDAGSRFGVPWEILYGLHLIETGLRDGPISNGSGPQGPLQFLPGTWANYGIDGNGDGTKDINNAVDAIYGAANYLAAHGGIESGLRSYGQVYDKVISAAKQRGWAGQ